MSHASRSLPEEIIHEARNGRMFLLVDDGDRENKGDPFVPAPMATPDAVDFMARHGRGLICLAMTKARLSSSASTRWRVTTARGTKLPSPPR